MGRRRSVDFVHYAPPEFGDLRAKSKTLANSDEAYRVALADEGHSYRDQRVRAVFAMASALGPALLPESLKRIDIPMVIVAGAADAIVPVGSSDPTPRIFRRPT